MKEIMDHKQAFEAMMKKRWPFWETQFSSTRIAMFERAFQDGVECAGQFKNPTGITVHNVSGETKIFLPEEERQLPCLNLDCKYNHQICEVGGEDCPSRQ